MSSSTFSIEDYVSRRNTYREIHNEYAHECVMEYKTERPTCPHCMHQLETQVYSLQTNFKTNTVCTCAEYTCYVSEHCKRCSLIKDEISFMKNEIRRAGLNYGIEVAETLETNPLFEVTIERFVLRIQMMEQILLRQQIERGNVRNDDEDEVSEMSVSINEQDENEQEYENEQEDDDQDELNKMDIPFTPETDTIYDVESGGAEFDYERYYESRNLNPREGDESSELSELSYEDIDDEQSIEEDIDGLTSTLLRMDINENGSNESGKKRKRTDQNEIIYDV